MLHKAAKDHLIVALDTSDRNYALRLCDMLAQNIAMAKIGLEAFIHFGMPFVHDVRKTGVDIFLDLKLHDIPRTARAAAQGLAELDIKLLTVHALGGPEMIEEVRTVLPLKTKLIAVTLLTSLDESTVNTLGFSQNVSETTAKLAHLALTHGADGVVSSGHELAHLKSLGGLRVVPGVRLNEESHGDQRRVMTPQQAVLEGADYIVVGRPIVAAANPLQATKNILDALTHAESFP